MRQRKAFTLIELLVVAGIIAILAAMLMPLMGRIQRHSRIVNCASNLRQVGAALNVYAAANEGRFPDMTINGGTGGNLWDVSISFCNELAKLGVPPQLFFCPGYREEWKDDIVENFTSAGTYRKIPYFIWIQRSHGGTDITPPPLNYSGATFKIVQPLPKVEFAGPRRLSDAIAQVNPIVTDYIKAAGIPNGAVSDPPASATADLPNNPYRISANNSHWYKGKIEGSNQLYADGHVEWRLPPQIHAYFAGSWGGWWHWR